MSVFDQFEYKLIIIQVARNIIEVVFERNIMYQQRKVSQIQQQQHQHQQSQSQSSNQFIANKFRQQQQPITNNATLNVSYSNPGTLKEIYESSQSDQIRQQRIVTSRKTAAKRAQRLLSASRNQNTTLSTQRNQQLQLQAATQYQSNSLQPQRHGQDASNFDKNQTLALSHSNQQPLHLLSAERPHIHPGGSSNVLSSVHSSIDYNNTNNCNTNAQQPPNNFASPHVNPLLSSETSQAGSLRQSLAFTNCKQIDSSQQFEVQDNRYSSCRVNSGNNLHSINGAMSGSDSASNILAMGPSGTNLPLGSHLVNNESTNSGSIVLMDSVAKDVSIQSLPPLSKQLLQRRSKMHPHASQSQTATASQSAVNLQKVSNNQPLLNQSIGAGGGRCREALLKIGQGVTSQQQLPQSNASLQPNLKLSLSQKRQPSRANRQHQTAVVAPQANSLTSAHEAIQSAGSPEVTPRSRFLKNSFSNATVAAGVGGTQPQAQSAHRVQRLPSFRKRRLDMNNNKDNLGDSNGFLDNSGTNQQHSVTKRSLVPQADGAPIMQIKSRISLASAAVDSRRSSTKKIKCGGSTSNSRKVTQSNFHTIPIKENSSLPTPLESVHKSSRRQTQQQDSAATLDHSNKISSSKGFSSGRQQHLQVSNEQFLSAINHNHINVAGAHLAGGTHPGTATTTAKSQRQLRYAGALPSQRMQILETQQNNSASTTRYSSTQAVDQQPQQQQVEMHSYQQRPRKQVVEQSQITSSPGTSVAQLQQQSSFNGKTTKTLPIAFIQQQRLRQTVASRESSIEKAGQQEHNLNALQTYQHRDLQQQKKSSQNFYIPIRSHASTARQQEEQRDCNGNKNIKQIKITHVTPSTQYEETPKQKLFQNQQNEGITPPVLQQHNQNTIKTVMQGMNCPSTMLSQLQQQRSTGGTRNTVSSGVTAHLSHETPEQRNTVEFAVRERRADSRPRGGAGQRFQQMRQRLQQMPYHPTQGKDQQQFIHNSFAGLETTSNEINESVRGIDHQMLLNIQAQFSGSDQEISNSMVIPRKQVLRDGGDAQATAGATAGKESIAGVAPGHQQLINEMSYIQNASSNDNLLSPNMFSNNSLSPTNQPLYLLEQQASIINNSLEPLSPHEINQHNQTKYSSLERSLQRVVVPQDNSKQIFDSGSKAPAARKIRRNFIRKISEPASKLFPPGFFADQNSIDSGKSPMKISVDSGSQLQQLQPTMSIRSNPMQPNSEIFSQSLARQVKQSEALEKAKALAVQQKKFSVSKPQLNVTLSPTRCALEIYRNPSLDDRFTKQSTGLVKKSLGQFNKDRLSMPEKKETDPICLLDQTFKDPQLQNEVTLRIKTSEASKLSAQPSLEAINAISDSIDGLNVPLPSAVTQNILERNSSQNLQNLPEVVHAPIQNQSKSHCPSKMGRQPTGSRNHKVLQGLPQSQNGTKMSDKTNNTFSDRVQKINKKNYSNQRSTLASKETNRTVPQSAQTKDQSSAASAIASQDKPGNNNNQACFNQNWVTAQQKQQKRNEINQKLTGVFNNEANNQSYSTTTIPDTSIGILSQSTAAASSGVKIQNKNNAKLQQNLVKKAASNSTTTQNLVVKNNKILNETSNGSNSAVEQGKKLMQPTTSSKLKIKFKASAVTNIQQKTSTQQTPSNNPVNTGTSNVNLSHKYTSNKVVPHLPMQLIAQSKASSPPEEFTPYMNGVLSPNSIASSGQISPGGRCKDNLMSLDRGDDPANSSSKFKIVSFGQSRCNSSQMAPEILLNNSGGPTQSGAGLANPQGIMTFGNFATLLQEQQQQQLSQRTFGQQNSSRRTLPETATEQH